MENREIARQFALLANLMELHGENAFKTKAYSSAFLSIRKWDTPIEEMSVESIDRIPGVGRSVISKIKELIATGHIKELEALKARTPEGIQQLLSVKGLGPKKVKVIWEALNIESPAELLYACNENRLMKLPGFGLKSQEDLRQKISYFLDSQNRYLYGNLEKELSFFQKELKAALPGHQVEWVGEYATMSPVISRIQCLVSPVVTSEQLISLAYINLTAQQDDFTFDILFDERISITIHTCPTPEFISLWSQLTMSEGLYQKVFSAAKPGDEKDINVILGKTGFKGLPPEMMDIPGIENAKEEVWSDLITVADIKGIIHNHSTYSDGMNSLEEMAIYVRDHGYEYFSICDHSHSAFYANGLQVERVLEQIAEIDTLNAKLAPFKIFKGIESDILGDGSLDYEPEILEKFDLIVASIHSNLRMDEAKAMSRLITAIENPYTRILGHPTGRLLLARQGYPINHTKIIDACAANGVAIELNANPLRLDVDYNWMDYCMEREVWVSINPDAHSRAQVDYVRFGVYAARKGGLKVKYCLNALSQDKFEQWLKKS
jgi:DNA polymerase (family 10)